MAASIAAAADGSGQRVMLASTSAIVTRSASTDDPMLATDSTHDTTSMPATRFNSLRATAPAATRAAVSRAEARPPPFHARMPYLAW